MAAHGDITASEVFQDRKMLNRLGYGIFDITWTKDSIGSENIRNFSYILAPDSDIKIYRRKVYELTGHYFTNALAKELWYKFLQHKLEMSAAGNEVELKQAAQDWLTNYGPAYLKEWVFKQREIPERIRPRPEAQRSWTAIMVGVLLPRIDELLEAGFTIPAILSAILKSVKPLPDLPTAVASGNVSPAPLKWLTPKTGLSKWGQFYMRLVAQLTGQPVRTSQEAQQHWSEILAHKAYLHEQGKPNINLLAVIVDYYRRLAFLEEVKCGDE